MRALIFEGIGLGHWSVENAGDLETVECSELVSACGGAVDRAIGGGLVSACGAGFIILHFWIAPATAAACGAVRIVSACYFELLLSVASFGSSWKWLL